MSTSPGITHCTLDFQEQCCSMSDQVEGPLAQQGSLGSHVAKCRMGGETKTVKRRDSGECAL